MTNQELVHRIKEYFNLNIYETKVWLALLSKGIVSAGETAEISGVPRSRTYDVLESLAKRGFAIVKVGKPVRYIAVEPKAVIEKMKTYVIDEANRKAEKLATLKDTPEYTELEQLHNNGISPIKSEDISGFLKGRPNVLGKIKEMLSNTEKEVTIYTTLEDFEDKSRVLLPLIQDISNKVNVKINLSGDQDRIKRLNNKYNLKIKPHNLNSKFYLTDKKEALFMIHPEDSKEEIAIWLNSPFFSEAMARMFDLGLKK